jgi:hypothetical protein
VFFYGAKITLGVLSVNMTLIIFKNDDSQKHQVVAEILLLIILNLQFSKSLDMISRKLLPIVFVLSGALIYASCIDKTPSVKEPLDTQELTKNQPEVHGKLVTPADIQLTNPLNAQWVTEGRMVYEVKCQACHKLTNEKLVGPGWAGLTQKRKPDWIINMITNVEVMLDKDPEAQKLLEECLVRMPNQNLTFEEARKVLEFQRHNDGEK